jgi:superfamily I DNA/RNA helicase
MFTTFTGNLARDVRSNLHALCGDEIGRADVIHLDSWAATYLAKRGIALDVADEDELGRYWNEALLTTGIDEYSVNFLRQEWEHVIQANNVVTREQYLNVARSGRGFTLSRDGRSKVWEVCSAFRMSLKSAGKIERSDIINEAHLQLSSSGEVPPYRAIVVDEVQDLSPEKLRLLRAMVQEGANDLFLAGDPSQRIYGSRITLKSCGINVRGRSSKLRINYRTTEQIRAWAVKVLHGVSIEDMDGEGDSLSGYRSLMSGPTPDIHFFSNAEQEQTFLAELLNEMLLDRCAEEICLVARTGNAIKQHYWPALEKQGIPCAVIDKSAELPRDKVRLATMHRVKGLEFPCMIVVGVNAGTVPMTIDGDGLDPQARAEHEVRERCILFVAATRARDRLVLTAYGRPSPYLEQVSSASSITSGC